MQADGSTAEAAEATGLQSFSGLSLQEENDMRLEHALEILKADVSFAQRSRQSQLHDMDSLGNINEICISVCYAVALVFQFSFCFTDHAVWAPFATHECVEMLQVESTGEALITIGGPGGWGPELLTEAELAVILKRVEKVMGAAFADMTILRQRKVPSNSEAAGELLAMYCLAPTVCHATLKFAVCHAMLAFVTNLASTGSVTNSANYLCLGMQMLR